MKLLRSRVTRCLPLVVALTAACSAKPTDRTASSAGAISNATWVDSNVESFKAFPTVSGLVYVLGSDGNLWREIGDMTDRTWVDGNVESYQPLDGTVIYVLGTDGNLWREVGSMATRTHVAGGVASFQVTTDVHETVYFTDSAGTLWRQPAGSSPALLAYDVRGFQWTPELPLDSDGLYVLRGDGELWRGTGDYRTHGQIDANASSFRAVDGMTVLVEGTDSKLWAEVDTFQTRTLVDTGVESFASLDGVTAFVADDAHQLWREEYGTPNRDQVDENVRAFEPVNRDTAYVLRFDGSLWLEALGAPSCAYSFSPPATTGIGRNLTYVEAWGIETQSGTCPTIPGANGAWAEMTDGYMPNVPTTGPSAPPTPTCATQGLPNDCCIYVWWPNSATAIQDPAALCTPDVVQMIAFDNTGSGCPTGLTCASPNGGGCDTCDLAAPGH
jgi:hypothetical protein